MRRLFLCCFAIAFLCSCAQEIQKEKIPFTFTPERKQISVPVTIQGVTGNFLFDTGAYVLGLDTTFAAKIAPYDSIRSHRQGYTRSDYAPENKSIMNGYDGLLKVQIGNYNFKAERFRVGDFRELLQIPEFDGIFGLRDIVDSTHVWELNFEENYISITPADSFQIDGDFLILPLKWKGETQILTALPITIRTKQGVEVKSEEEYLIDTGSYTDILFLNNTEEAKKLNTKNDSAYWLHDYHFWEGEINVCNRVKLDSARVYVHDYPLSNKRTLGLNFFKRFNVYFDMKNRQLYLKPIKKKFERIKFMKRGWGDFTLKRVGKYDVAIDRICDYKDNPAIKAGFQVGDKILTINGIDIHSNSFIEDEDILMPAKTWNCHIYRNGKLLNLTLHRNLDKQIED